jgi:glyoxylase-like metal-dependent hydrolase (beta-lactamase superfamily II)
VSLLGIVHSSGHITDNIIHVDLEQYNSFEVCSAFLITSPDSHAILDCGTSNDVPTLLTYLTSEHQISLKKIKYLIPTHYHFDHFGGGWSLWNQIKEYNPDVKILTTSKTKKQLQDPELHMKRAYRTFGKMIGEMRSIPDEAFEIVNPNEEVLLPGFTDTQSLSLVPSPGHCEDHVCPTLFDHQKTEFMFLGEAAGTRMHSQNLLTLGTSMPPEFNYATYIKSLEHLIELYPMNIGLGHFGVIKGTDNTLKLMKKNLEFTHRFRTYVKEKFEEKNETRWIVEQFIENELEGRVETSKTDMRFLTRIIVALVYGQLIDLGFRDPR